MNFVNLKKVTMLSFSLLIAFLGQTVVCEAAAKTTYSDNEIFRLSRKTVCRIFAVKKEAGGKLTVSKRGTGMFLDHEGHVLTAAHVVEKEPGVSFQVSIEEKNRVYRARPLGLNTLVDCAIIKIDSDSGSPFTTDDFDTVTLGDSSSVNIGDTAYTLGTALGDYPLSFTKGIVSGLHRQLLGFPLYVQDLIQHDAPTNPGNSGGPLLNSQNEVIGLTNFSIKGPKANSVGFAVPINHVNIEQLKRGDTDSPTHIGFETALFNFPRLSSSSKASFDDMIAIYQLTGISNHEDLAAIAVGTIYHGAFITDLSPVAIDAGFKQGDVVTSIDNHEIKDGMEIRVLLLKKAFGKRVAVNVLRAENGKMVSRTISSILY